MRPFSRSHALVLAVALAAAVPSPAAGAPLRLNPAALTGAGTPGAASPGNVLRAPAAPAALINTGVALTLSGAAAQFGSAVAVAGDVNGDGYSDLIVGAPFYSNGQGSEGEVLVYLGGPNGYAATPAWTFESNVAGALLGWSVAPAGDVNGDGYADVIVGAPGLSSNALTSNGRAYVFLGGPSGLAATPAWTFDGTQGGELLGWSVCTAGDVNGDGYDDVIVGSPGYYNIAAPRDGARRVMLGPASAQTAFVFNNGRAQAFLGGSSGLATTPQWDHAGSQYGGAFGYSVSTANDIDADGYDDVVVGAPYGANLYTSVAQAGEFDVYGGGPSGLASTAAAVVYGQGTGELRGFSVAGVGDINGDGYADIVVGAPGYTNAAASQGAIFGYRGSAMGLNLDWDFSDEGPVVLDNPGGQFGNSVAPAGDVNGDGYADFIAGAPFYTTGPGAGVDVGYMAVYQGTPVNGGTPKTAYARLAFSVSGATGSELGYSVCAAGDEDGDGFGDVVVGAPTFSSSDGRVALYRGAADMPETQPGWNQPNAYAAGGPAWDINGDGYNDVAVERNSTTLDFYAGGPKGPAGVPTWSLTPTQLDPSMTIIVYCAQAGDVNGDGYDDVVVSGSSPSDTANFWVPGGPAGPDPSGAKRLPSPPDPFQVSYIGIGDVNGDGYADIAMGTDTLAIYLGGPAGPATSAVWTSPLKGADWVLGLGDVNGDGYGDIIVSDRSYSGNLPGQGIVQIFLGGSHGPSEVPSATYLGPAASSQLWGGPAGDLNGDGLADFWVYDGSTNSLTVHYGNDALPPTTIAGSSTGPGLKQPAIGEHIGDVNEDGFDDLEILGYEVATQSQVGVQVYLGSASGVGTSPVFDWRPNPNFVVFYPPISVGDVNGDGAADIEINNDSLNIFLGNSGVTGTAGLDRIARQRRASDSAPIGLLGLSDSPNQFRLAANGRSPAGRTRVRMETDVKSWGLPFETNLGNLVHDAWSPTGAPGSDGSFVALDALRALPTSRPTEKWRMRIAAHSPYFPWTPWLSPPGNGRNEFDLRNATSFAGLPAADGSPTRLELAAPSPNPSAGEAVLSFALPRRTSVELAIFDLQGRRVATLASGEAAAGVHEARWDGHDASGHLAPAGVYLARLVAGGQRLTSKVVRVR